MGPRPRSCSRRPAGGGLGCGRAPRSTPTPRSGHNSSARCGRFDPARNSWPDRRRAGSAPAPRRRGTRPPGQPCREHNACNASVILGGRLRRAFGREVAPSIRRRSSRHLDGAFLGGYFRNMFEKRNEQTNETAASPRTRGRMALGAAVILSAVPALAAAVDQQSMRSLEAYAAAMYGALGVPVATGLLSLVVYAVACTLAILWLVAAVTSWVSRGGAIGAGVFMVVANLATALAMLFVTEYGSPVFPAQWGAPRGATRARRSRRSRTARPQREAPVMRLDIVR